MSLRYLEIAGGTPLRGEITIQGSKNAALPILAACLVGEGPCTIQNCPEIGDVEDLLRLMEQLGCKTQREGNAVRIDSSMMDGFEIEGPEAARIRSSILFLGPLLGKMGKAVLPMPGGCAIGERPIDLHLCALQSLGAQICIEETGRNGRKRIMSHAQRLCGGEIYLSFPSVGATENTILAAVQADGETVLHNAAREPEIDELCAFLKLRGARIDRLADGSIRIDGGAHLRPVVWRLRADRIVTGTYLLAAMASGGRITVTNFPHGDLDALLDVLERMGGRMEKSGGSMCVAAERKLRAVPYVETAPYPGFPTDLQSPLMAVLCLAEGTSVICEKVFESRFRTVPELIKMGACIGIQENCACITGREWLSGAVLEAPDLRGGAALVIAAVCAHGCTVIRRTEYIERGYEDICRDFGKLGAKLRLMEDGEFQA